MGQRQPWRTLQNDSEVQARYLNSVQHRQHSICHVPASLVARATVNTHLPCSARPCNCTASCPTFPQEARFDRHFVRDLQWSRHQLEELAERRFMAAQVRPVCCGDKLVVVWWCGGVCVWGGRGPLPGHTGQLVLADLHMAVGRVGRQAGKHAGSSYCSQALFPPQLSRI